MIDFNNQDNIRGEGFSGFQSISSLQDNYDLIPKRMGVYLVIYNKPSIPEFLAEGTGGHFKGKNPNVPTITLHENWVKGTSVIYIGKAGGPESSATLHSRIKQYLRFGQGKPVGHWGGRFIWQIKDSGSLQFCWKTLINTSPRQYEQELIDHFKSKYFTFPFANLVR